MKRLFPTLMVAGLLSILGCDQKSTSTQPNLENPSTVTMDDVRRDTSNALETTATYSKQNKDLLVKDLKEQLTIMDAKIDELRLKGKGLASDAKVKWDVKMSELEIKRKSASAKLTDIENSSAEAWGDVEKGAQSAWVELKKAYQDASNEF